MILKVRGGELFVLSDTLVCEELMSSHSVLIGDCESISRVTGETGLEVVVIVVVVVVVVVRAITTFDLVNFVALELVFDMATTRLGAGFV